ncbi:MAG: putative Ig domain-containing protein [Opitutales bacterium]
MLHSLLLFLTPMNLPLRLLLLSVLALTIGISPALAQDATRTPGTPPPEPNAPVPALPPPLTPPPAHTPRVNGPQVFGVRPGSPFLYAIPATGDRPMTFSAAGLPDGLQLDPATGRITGVLSQPGNFSVTLGAKNALGSATRPFRIVGGDQITLTPPMGWNSWNCWAGAVDQDKVLRAAQAMVASGLAQHGWTFVNIDDTWQGARGGPFNAIQPDPKKFPDIKSLADAIHQLGLKAGIYSTPWITSYARHVGGSANTADGAWPPPRVANSGNTTTPPVPGQDRNPGHRFGQYPFATPDAKQWAAWGFDYLKYDWNPNDIPHVQEMADALRASGRDLTFSLSNAAPFANAADWARLANVWRTTGDIRDTWRSMSSNGFSQDRWAPFAGPGHWNDPDMLVVGRVGWGPTLHASHLTPDEQYTHISLWCLLSAPLLLGCDLEQLDPFTLGLLTNDEVLDLDQDALGKEATQVAGDSVSYSIYAKSLADGSLAVGLFNRGPEAYTLTVKWTDLGLTGPQHVRDLWRQQDLGVFTGQFSAPVPSHGVVLVRLFHDSN